VHYGESFLDYFAELKEILQYLSNDKLLSSINGNEVSEVANNEVNGESIATSSQGPTTDSNDQSGTVNPEEPSADSNEQSGTAGSEEPSADSNEQSGAASPEGASTASPEDASPASSDQRGDAESSGSSVSQNESDSDMEHDYNTDSDGDRRRRYDLTTCSHVTNPDGPSSSCPHEVVAYDWQIYTGDDRCHSCSERSATISCDRCFCLFHPTCVPDSSQINEDYGGDS